jgi:hypothetical protein
MRWRWPPLVAVVALLLASPTGSPAQSSRAPGSASSIRSSASQARADDNLERLAANARRDLARYRATLGPVLAAYERELGRQKELAAARQDLYERGAMSEGEVRAGKRAVAAAQRDVDETRQAMAEADRMMGEARMADVERARPLARGQYEETAGLVRFAGLAEWSLATDTPRLQAFFRGRFGRALPISAFGQTALHDRMGFDHRNALDVALHPDSPEGRALMSYLRTNGIPFIAAWGVVPGQTSGAHIHVGQPSPRLLVRR